MASTLQGELEAAGIWVKPNSRCLPGLTLFSGLVEAEAIQLGNDFNHIVSTSFPSFAIGRKLAVESSVELDAENLQASILQKVTQLQAARAHVNEVLAILDRDSSPILDSYPPQILEEAVQRPLTSFSMLSHGFGNLAFKAVMKSYAQILDTQIASFFSR